MAKFILGFEFDDPASGAESAKNVATILRVAAEMIEMVALAEPGIRMPVMNVEGYEVGLWWTTE